MNRRTSQFRRNASRKISYLILFVLIVLVLFKTESQSVLFRKMDRLNLVFYSQDPYFLSVSTEDNVNYVVDFHPDLKIRVPGGYGPHRVGALGKLVYLDRKPEIFKSAFSAATSTMVDLYFYKNKDEVYYGGKREGPISLPNIPTFLFSSSNATLLDRIYLSLKFTTLKKSDFTRLSPISEIRGGDDLFLDADFSQEYAGFFYKKSYRNERRTVQIIYTKSRKNADLISRMLENSGIRVVDNFFSKNVQKKCTIIEEESFSRTAKDLANFFECQLKNGETRLSDIIIELGSQEDKWAFE